MQFRPCQHKSPYTFGHLVCNWESNERKGPERNKQASRQQILLKTIKTAKLNQTTHSTYALRSATPQKHT